MILLSFIFIMDVQASFVAEPREQAIIRTGPGHTFASVGRLHWSDEVTLLERNRIGNWLYIQVERGEETVTGWVPSGYLVLGDDVRFSEMPVADAVADADPTTVNSRTLAQLYAVPVLPQISDAMREIYERGQALGNYSNVITKVGDSVSTSPIFLTPMWQGDHELGPYDHLNDTIDLFGGSVLVESMASKVGLSSLAVFDPIWADADFCQPNESPLACEYRRKQPSIAVILFGPNDVRSMDEERYGEQMSRIVEESIENGVIPVLVTFSADPDAELWWPSIHFNLKLVEVADAYEVPLINLWAAARILPEYGLDRDRVHLKHSGRTNIFFKNGDEAYYGITLLNLLTICTLDEIRLTLGMG